MLATLTPDRETARNVVQEACAVALSKRRQYRGEGTLEGWVWKIALRLAAGLHAGSSKPLPPDLDCHTAGTGACVGEHRRGTVFRDAPILFVAEVAADVAKVELPFQDGTVELVRPSEGFVLREI